MSPWPGKCLAQAATPPLLQAADHGRAQPADQVGVVAERAVADDRVLRVGVHVHDGREVAADAAGAGAPRPAPPPSGAPVSSEPMRPSARSGGQTVQGSAQPRDAAALLVDRRRGAAGRARRRGRTACSSRTSSATCSGLVHVAGEEDDVADAEVADEALHVRRGRVPVEADHEPLRRPGGPLLAHRTGVSAPQPLADGVVDLLAVGGLAPRLRARPAPPSSPCPCPSATRRPSPRRACSTAGVDLGVATPPRAGTPRRTSISASSFSHQLRPARLAELEDRVLALLDEALQHRAPPRRRRAAPSCRSRGS